MYKIALRDGSPVSVGRMIEVDGAADKISTGQLLCIIEGRSYLGSSAQCPDALASEAYGDTGGGYPEKVVAMLLTEDMFLEAPVSGTDSNIAALTAGEFIAFDCETVTAGTTSNFCQIVDTLGAKKSGDKILVRFLHNNVKS